MSKLTRRDFTKIATAASVSTALGSGRVLGANDRIRLGCIAIGNRGDQVLDGFLAHKDAEVVAVCDIHQPYMDFASKKIGGSPRQFKDYRKLLEMKDVDAVVIATPDHWHALQMIHACQAGKDVYVEKPLSLAVAEGRRMVEAAERHKRVVQVGLQRRSSEYCREAVEFIRGGGIGKVTSARAFHIQNEWPKGIGKPPNEEPPADFDWEAWLGPAPKVPYNKNRAFYRFRWFYGYSGGQLTNMGVHYMDMIHWALGHDAPVAVTAMGGNFAVEDNREIPDTLEVVWQYQNSQGGGALVSFTQINASAPLASARNCDVEFRGTKGALYLMDNGYEVVPDDITPNEFPVRTPLDRTAQRGWRAGQRPMIAAKKVEGRTQDAHHARNFLDCVRSRERCHCDIETGHRSTSATLLGNIAYKTKSYLEWD
ncbi:MAG TPA: Gfo/Idh/MocA family oxidoreductase, partial [Blastocatellia bacterium]|nr:Gfo/Idh/MocA family oxidoreductase [Blastocatellia bacterium]